MHKRYLIVVEENFGKFRTFVEVYDQFPSHYKDAVVIKELEGLQSAGKCIVCKKPFSPEEDVLTLHMLRPAKIQLLNERVAYFYSGAKESSEQLRYIVHANCVPQKTLNEFMRGQALWDEGMAICNKIQKDIFKDW